jgi:disulfide bond formation protein DsbB
MIRNLTMPTLWPLLAALVSAAMLATAHGFETFGGYAPCLLCLRQREVYWAAIAVGLLGFAAAAVRPTFGRVASILLLGLFAAGTLVAGFHAGVEWKWWPGPTSCAGPTGAIAADALADLLAGAKMRPPACDVAAWRMFGLSMAGYNALASAVLTVVSACAAYGGRKGASSLNEH